MSSDVGTLTRWTLQAVFVGAILAFVIHQLERLWRQFKTSTLKQNYSDVFSDARVAQLTQQVEKSRDERQATYTEQAQDYDERIARPREEEKRAAQEQRFYRLSGPAWKGRGQRLGFTEEDDGPIVRRRPVTGSGRDAAEVRSLPPEDIKSPAPAPAPKIKLVHKLSMPMEPGAGEGVITVAFKTPGRPHRRRFHTTDTVQLMLDYMTTLGYHQKLYTLFTYPHVHIAETPDVTLDHLGLTRDFSVYVEERE